MALPKLNSVPLYTDVIPSTNQEVSFRPFFVKEQKNLLIAYETQDRIDLAKAIVRTIHSCVEDEIKSPLTTFDADYLFTKIRAKSVGETTEVSLTCSECESQTDVSINLDDVEVSKGPESNRIQLTEDISIEMRYPSYEDILKTPEILSAETATDAIMRMVCLCIDTILTEEERYSVKDESPEELVEFIDSMTSEQFEKVADYVNSVPSVKKTVEFPCSNCGHHNSLTLEGMDDFF